MKHSAVLILELHSLSVQVCLTASWYYAHIHILPFLQLGLQVGQEERKTTEQQLSTIANLISKRSMSMLPRTYKLYFSATRVYKTVGIKYLCFSMTLQRVEIFL